MWARPLIEGILDFVETQINARYEAIQLVDRQLTRGIHEALPLPVFQVPHFLPLSLQMIQIRRSHWFPFNSPSTLKNVNQNCSFMNCSENSHENLSNHFHEK